MVKNYEALGREVTGHEKSSLQYPNFVIINGYSRSTITVIK